jgi:hypothetical protein
MGPYEATSDGNRYLLVVTDLFSRWVEAFAVKAATARVTTTILEKEVFSRSRYPRAVLTDNGSQLRSGVFRRACHRWQVKHWPTANYHPRSNPTERRNQEIKKILRIARQMFPNQNAYDVDSYWSHFDTSGHRTCHRNRDWSEFVHKQSRW